MVNKEGPMERIQLIAYANLCVNFLWGGGFAAEWVNDKSDCWVFPSLPSSTAEQDGMGEGEGWLGTERLKSTKPF